MVVLACALLVATAALGRQDAAPPTPSGPVGEAPSARPAPDTPETEVLLIDGRRLTGLLVAQDDATITLRVVGIDTPLARKDVSRLRTLPDVGIQLSLMGPGGEMALFR